MRLFLFVFPTLLLLPGSTAAEISLENEFSRSIQPVLAKNCFPCHGPDETSRAADLRLDTRDAAIEGGAITPDDLSSSPLLERIHSDDPDLRMPPPESGRSLTPEEQDLIAQWVQRGATYTTHWAWRTPQKSPIPPDTSWSPHPVDRFLFAKMQASGLQPTEPADRRTIIRRLYQDLLGLLPTPDAVATFVQDASPNAYEHLVDRLLASPQYGEHWARSWLDLARYSDTNGYEKDRPRSIWPYRDWVVDAINSDLPYDQFSIEQLAGDMLPSPSRSQKIATGFHRNTMLNEEGGIDPLEYRFYAMVDRVATTGTVWMGLTIGCAQCHTHKYDPISHTDFYRFFALLNNADEPDLRFPETGVSETGGSETANHATSELERQQTELQKKILHGPHRKAYEAWLSDLQEQAVAWQTIRADSWQSNLPKLETLEDGSIFASGDFTKRDEYQLQFRLADASPITAIRLEALPDDRLPARGPGRTYYEGRKGQFFLSELEIRIGGKPAELHSTFAPAKSAAKPSVLFDGDGSSGWTNSGSSGQRHVAVFQLQQPTVAKSLEVRMLFERHFVASLGRFRISVTYGGPTTAKALPVTSRAESLLCKDPATWTDSDHQHLAAEFLRLAAEMTDARKSLDQLRRRVDKSIETLVMQERPADNPRITHRHHRGEWLNPQEVVTGNVPALFPQLPEDQANRLGLARWLVSPKNPLFARVFVNRHWRHLMGYGMVRSDGDFGTQSSPPTHPELLDWLACEFIDQGMSRKRFHKMIVMSAAYRQRSDVPPDVFRRDPTNRFFARGPRHRLNGETIRDMILQAAGQLSSNMGGPGVRPPQPRSVTQIAYGNPSWQASKGEDRYRRSLYTFQKRTAPFAAYATFDGPSGETCIARRNRSNTPLQALTLLNDTMFVELAQRLGDLASQSTSADHEVIDSLFQRLLTRSPSADEHRALHNYYLRQRERLGNEELSSAEILGDRKIEADRRVRAAAFTLVSRVLMNLDEMITKH